MRSDAAPAISSTLFSSGTQLNTLVQVGVNSLNSGTSASSTTFWRGDGTWATPTSPTGANPTALVALTAVNGVATTFMRSDAAPPLDQSISPTMSGTWVFSHAGTAVTVQNNATVNGTVLIGTTSGGAYTLDVEGTIQSYVQNIGTPTATLEPSPFGNYTADGSTFTYNIYSYTASGIAYASNVVATNSLADPNDGSTFYNAVSWTADPRATSYTIVLVVTGTDPDIRWASTTATSFNDGNGIGSNLAFTEGDPRPLTPTSGLYAPSIIQGPLTVRDSITFPTYGYIANSGDNSVITFNGAGIVIDGPNPVAIQSSAFSSTTGSGSGSTTFQQGNTGILINAEGSGNIVIETTTGSAGEVNISAELNVVTIDAPNSDVQIGAGGMTQAFTASATDDISLTSSGTFEINYGSSGFNGIQFFADGSAEWNVLGSNEVVTIHNGSLGVDNGISVGIGQVISWGDGPLIATDGASSMTINSGLTMTLQSTVTGQSIFYDLSGGMTLSTPSGSINVNAQYGLSMTASLGNNISIGDNSTNGTGNLSLSTANSIIGGTLSLFGYSGITIDSYGQTLIGSNNTTTSVVIYPSFALFGGTPVVQAASIATLSNTATGTQIATAVNAILTAIGKTSGIGITAN